VTGEIDLAVPPRDLVESTTRFCRQLRARGLLVSPEESIDAVRALTTIDLGDHTDVYLALRALLTSRHEDLGVFDEEFERWWRTQRNASRGESGPTPDANRSGAPPRSALPPPPSIYSLKRWGTGPDADGGEASIPSPSALA
jgi:uncharacterized protein with von Willebrand factor type A (vWA) domain